VFVVIPSREGYFLFAAALNSSQAEKKQIPRGGHHKALAGPPAFNAQAPFARHNSTFA